jgi:hypothetical protein
MATLLQRSRARVVELEVGRCARRQHLCQLERRAAAIELALAQHPHAPAAAASPQPLAASELTELRKQLAASSERLAGLEDQEVLEDEEVALLHGLRQQIAALQGRINDAVTATAVAAPRPSPPPSQQAPSASSAAQASAVQAEPPPIFSSALREYHCVCRTVVTTALELPEPPNSPAPGSTGSGNDGMVGIPWLISLLYGSVPRTTASTEGSLIFNAP